MANNGMLVSPVSFYHILHIVSQISKGTSAPYEDELWHNTLTARVATHGALGMTLPSFVRHQPAAILIILEQPPGSFQSTQSSACRTPFETTILPVSSRWAMNRLTAAIPKFRIVLGLDLCHNILPSTSH